MPITQGQNQISAWRKLSAFTALVVFFSGISPVTAHAAGDRMVSAKQLVRTHSKMEKLMQNPAFPGCRQIQVVIHPRDLESFEFMVSSSSHIEVSSSLQLQEEESRQTLNAYKLRSILWVPQSAEFRQDYEELRQIETLSFANCSSHSNQRQQ